MGYVVVLVSVLCCFLGIRGKVPWPSKWSERANDIAIGSGLSAVCAVVAYGSICMIQRDVFPIGLWWVLAVVAVPVAVVSGVVSVLAMIYCIHHKALAVFLWAFAFVGLVSQVTWCIGHSEVFTQGSSSSGNWIFVQVVIAVVLFVAAGNGCGAWDDGVTKPVASDETSGISGLY